MTKAILFGLGLALVLFAGAQPALAQCDVTTVCVTVTAGMNAQDIADLIESNWHLPDYACSTPAVTPGGVQVSATAGTRTIVFQVPSGTIQSGFDFDLRFGIPLSGGGSPPFDIFADYDNQGEVPLREGSTVFPEITVVVVTQSGGGPGGGGGVGGGFGVMDNVRAVALVAGLLLAGVVILLIRRI